MGQGDSGGPERRPQGGIPERGALLWPAGVSHLLPFAEQPLGASQQLGRLGVEAIRDAAYARVIARDPERCGVGYVSGTGEPISPVIVEGETVCIEQRHLDAQQVIQGLPGSPATAA
jgi:hypothetical protein